MSAEIEHFDLRENNDVLVGTTRVFPGSYESIDFFNPAAKLLVFGGVNNAVAILIDLRGLGADERLEAIIYEDERDNEGSEVSLEGGRISIQRPQELSIFLLREEDEEDITEKELSVYWSGDDEDAEMEFPKESRPLVLV